MDTYVPPIVRFEQGPEVLDSVRMDAAPNVLVNVVDDLVHVLGS